MLLIPAGDAAPVSEHHAVGGRKRKGRIKCIVRTKLAHNCRNWLELNADLLMPPMRLENGNPSSRQWFSLGGIKATNALARTCQTPLYRMHTLECNSTRADAAAAPAAVILRALTYLLLAAHLFAEGNYDTCS